MRPVARRVLCAAPDAALRVPCVVPVVAQFARFAVPDAAPCQTSPCLRAASLARWASWWLGLPPLTSSELLTKRPLQMPPRIQEKRERCADRPAWPLNLDPFPCSRFLPRGISLVVESRAIDLDQLRRAHPSHAGISTEGIDTLGRWGMMVPAVTISPSLNLVRAKSLAAASVSNVCVKRGCRRFNSVPSVGTS